MKDAAELCRGLLRKAKSDRIAVELRYDDSFWPTQQVAEEAQASARAVSQFVLDRLPPDVRKAAE